MKILLLLFTTLLIGWSSSQAADVRINELLASNGSFYPDEDGSFSDWIELHNTSAASINLAEWSLTDNSADPGWEFPDVTIAPGQYLVVYASGNNRTSPNLHTSFSLSIDGEYLALRRPDGTLASVFDPGFPAQQRDISYGLDASGNYVFFSSPTPGTANGGGVVDFVADTKFSHDRGFYDAPFDVTITTATAGATIRYTTNGIAPTASTGLVYSSPVSIRGTTVLRAAAFKTGFQPSNVDTHTFLFLADVVQQSPAGQAPPGWPSSWGGNVVDYGMDPDVVNNPAYRDTIVNDLKTIPSFSVVMSLDDLFNSSTGIYANPGQDGRTWERPCSVELLNPDGTEGFQINAGIRIRGGFSRSTSNPKHAFRLFFRNEYGQGKLEYPVHGETGTDRFDNLDLRTFQNYSWSFQGDASGVFLRDQFSRDTQLEMGYNAERGNFYHLYINGHYWGLYNSCERPEASYAETYYGGTKEDYDVIKVEAGSYTINATDGTMAAWNTLYTLAKSGFTTDANYQKVQGNNPDGTPNPAYPVLLDFPNLIDYMLVIIYTGNKDAPISAFLGNDSPNNWYGLRNRRIEARQGFQFFAHDSEHTLLRWELGQDRTGPFSSGETSVTKSNPQWIWQKLWAHPEFKLLVADHIHRHFFNNGLLTPQQNQARFLRRKNEIDRAVVAESARWGDAKRSNPMTRNNEWVNAINSVLNNYFPDRSQIVFDQLQSHGLYPNVAAPSFSRQGGNVDPGFSLTMSAPAGTICYTLDGTDPRVYGGSVAPSARTYSGAIVLNENATVKARVRSGNTWSALNEAQFVLIRTFKELLITEIMYNPRGEQGIDGEEFEFVELKNVGAAELDLSGVHFTSGINYRFPNGTRLSPGAFVVLVNNETNFTGRYPGVLFDGVFTNNLANSGETLALVHAAGAPIQSLTYDDATPWPTTADGSGFSLVPTTFDLDADFSNPLNWRASSALGGSPRADDAPLDIPAVVINEVLTHTDPPQSDSVEILNPTSEEANLGGWFLTDNPNTPKKYQLPANTTVAAGEYLVLDEGDFNPNPGVDPSFSFDSHGEGVYLYSADANGNLTGYSTGFAFGAAPNGVSFGRYLNSVDEILYPAQLAVTLGEENAGPNVGPIVFNEIRYAPALGDDEFVELKNITTGPVKLYDSLTPENRWKIEGLAFSFPANIEVPANGLVVVTSSDPSLFRARNNVPETVQVFGPYGGQLQDGGELIRLQAPDSPDEGPGGATIVPYYDVDVVRYSDRSPWPPAVNGPSIEKLVAGQFGNDPASWRVSPGPASPGLENDGNRLPVVNAGPDVAFVETLFPFATSLTATATDDGNPNPPGSLTYLWTQVSGPGETVIDNPTQLAATFHFPGVGSYVLRFTAHDSEFPASDEITINISRPLETATFIAPGSAWKFLDDGSNQGTPWRTLTFPDASWPSGSAQFGYGDGDEATQLGYGPDPGNKFVTYYFRKSFSVPNAAAVTEMTVKLMRDDGAIVYLNGTEVFRSNMPEGAVDYRTYASSVVGGGDESAFFEKPVNAALLVDGNNVLAVEIHQQNGNSSDLSFDLELSGLVNFSNQAPTADAGPDLVVDLPAPADLVGEASDDGLPTPPGVFTATWSKLNGSGNVSFASPNSLRTTATFSEPGTYILRLSITDGQLNATDDIEIIARGGDLYSAWLEAHFSADELENPEISGEGADPDGDGFLNEQEFIAGTDPRDPESYLHVENVLQDGDDLVIQFEAVGDKAYSIQARDSAAAGEWETILNLSPQGTTDLLEVLDATINTGPRRFYRIVTPQPQLP